jgi:hypothetical protein
VDVCRVSRYDGGITKAADDDGSRYIEELQSSKQMQVQAQVQTTS